MAPRETGSVGTSVSKNAAGKSAAEKSAADTLRRALYACRSRARLARSAGAQGRQARRLENGAAMHIDVMGSTLYIQRDEESIRRCLISKKSSTISPLLDDWDDRYRYLIELGRELPPLHEAATQRRQQGAGLRQPGLARHRVRRDGAGGPVLTFRRQRRPYRARADRHPVCASFPASRRAIFSNRCARAVRAYGLAGTSHPSALEWLPVHGRAHSRRCAWSSYRHRLGLRREVNPDRLPAVYGRFEVARARWLPVEPLSRSRSLMEHDLFGNPLIGSKPEGRAFPDHALRSAGKVESELQNPKIARES